MAEKSSFFTSLNGDRRYKANDFAEYFSTFIGNGVFPNPASNLQVVSNGDMTLTLYPGFAWINGYMYANTDNLTLTVEHSDAALKRIDRVVVRCDFIGREIRTYVKKGIFASSPVVPTLERGANAYEISIADIYIDNGVITIAQSKITDTRLNSELCGIVTQTVNTIDTSVLYKQLEHDIQEKGLDMQTWLDGAKEYFSNWLQLTQSEFSSEFNTWFDGIKNILDESTAGTLLNMINANSTRIDDVEQQLANIDTTAEKTTIVDTSNLFESTNVEGALSEVMTKSNEALRFGVNAKTGMKEAINSKITVPNVTDADAWNTYIQRVKDIKEGRGNAVVGDVLSGKTFTNDSGQMLTGTMVNRSGVINSSGTAQWPDGSLAVYLPEGYYNGVPGQSEVKVPTNLLQAADGDLVASNILSGKNIFGVNGTLKPAKMATGTAPFSNINTVVTVRGLNFEPHAVVGVTYGTNGGVTTYHNIPSLAVNRTWLTGGYVTGGIVVYGPFTTELRAKDVTFYSDGFQLYASQYYPYQNTIRWYAFRYE